ncbi:MAG: hypothetical protein Q9209_002185 [Squamulea sp. 1 TL-2023]
MANDHLEQQRLAAALAASADGVHDVPASTNRLQMRAFTQAPPSDDSSTLSRVPCASVPTHQHLAGFLDVPHPANSNVHHLAGQTNSIERNRAHEAALRRLTGQDSQSGRKSKTPGCESVASTQPVLVREYSEGSSTSGSPRHTNMRSTKRSNGYRSSEMPSLESFSFQDILASIDSDVHVSIDKIAEICGRSKMSLADEYSSHMPPQSDFTIPGLQENGDLMAVSRLDPVEEALSTHEDATEDSRGARSRIARLSLASSGPNHSDLLSAPITATSAVGPQTRSSAIIDNVSNPENRESYVPQLFAWIRTSRGDDSRSPQASKRDSGAANALHRILSSDVEKTMH